MAQNLSILHVLLTLWRDEYRYVPNLQRMCLELYIR